MAGYRKKRSITMNAELLPIGFGHGYDRDVTRIADYFRTDVIWGLTPEGKNFVYIKYVFGDTIPHKPYQGLGTTLLDACEDYMRQIRGARLLNIVSNKVGTFV
jgi:hypothetical protein